MTSLDLHVHGGNAVLGEGALRVVICKNVHVSHGNIFVFLLLLLGNVLLLVILLALLVLQVLSFSVALGTCGEGPTWFCFKFLSEGLNSS